MIDDRTKRNLVREFKQSPAAWVGVAAFLTVVIAAIFAPFVATQSPNVQNLPASQTSPTWAYPMGTDNLGRDIFSRVVYGARVSLVVGILAVMTSAIIGVVLGIVAGYKGGWLDDVIMRASDTMLTVPGLMVAITIFGVIGPLQVSLPDPWVMSGLVSDRPEVVQLPGTIIIALGITGWVRFARISRGEALSVRNEDYVSSAVSIGAGSIHVMKKHILPNSLTPIMILATIRVANAILSESSLAFLGFSGASVSWGLDIAYGREYLVTAWWVPLFPGLAIVTAIVGINLLGDVARDALDPNLSEGNAR